MVVEEDFYLTVDLVLTGFIPGDVVLAINKLLLETLSVLTGLNVELLVHLHDFSELGDGQETNLLVGFILNVSGMLGINVRLLKVLKEVENGVNGITSLGSGLEEG